MKRKRFTVEQTIRMLREAEVHISHGTGQNPRAPKGPLSEMNGATMRHRVSPLPSGGVWACVKSPDTVGTKKLGAVAAGVLDRKITCNLSKNDAELAYRERR